MRAEAVKLVSRYKLGPMFDPPLVGKLDGPLALLHLPSATGGTNWPGGSYDPETHIAYVFSQTNISALGLVPPPSPEVSETAYISGTALTGARLTGGSGSANAAPPGRGGAGEGAGPSLTRTGFAAG